MKTLVRIKNILKEIKPELEKKYNVKEIGIFGSYVRSEQKKKSDIDILVEFHENAGLTLFDFIGLEDYLSRLLGRKVDLVEKKVLKPYIGKIILSEVIYI